MNTLEFLSINILRNVGTSPVYFIDRIGIIAKLMPFFGENIYLLRSHANFRRGGASNGHNYNKQTNVTYFVSVLNFIDINTIHFFIKKYRIGLYGMEQFCLSNSLNNLCWDSPCSSALKNLNRFPFSLLMKIGNIIPSV